MRKQYTVSDGKLVLILEPAEEGGYIVTSPLEPRLITEAETVEEAFEQARDALKALSRSRRIATADELEILLTRRLDNGGASVEATPEFWAGLKERARRSTGGAKPRR